MTEKSDSERSTVRAPAEPLPSISDLLLKVPLYRKIALAESDSDYVKALCNSNIKFDAYCLGCGAASIFRTMRSSGGGAGLGRVPQPNWLAVGQVQITVYCARELAHRMDFYLRIVNGQLAKIGQFPSVSDLAVPELDQYRQLLGADRSSELRKAVMLAANGVGVGSFVYLRRIFESLLDQHRGQQGASATPDDEWNKMRVDDRIKALEGALPPFLVENKSMYGILSKGVHELTEEECLAYFPVLRGAIVLILEEDAQRKRNEDLRRSLGVEINKISSRLGSSPSS